jgi:hypothetical protein
MNSVGMAASKNRSHCPQADQINNTVSVPLVLDVKRYFKPLWKAGHLLDNNLKPCGYCLRPQTAQIFPVDQRSSYLRSRPEQSPAYLCFSADQNGPGLARATSLSLN